MYILAQLLSKATLQIKSVRANGLMWYLNFLSEQSKSKTLHHLSENFRLPHKYFTNIIK